jgi:predicted transcriptional regulator
MAAKPRVTVRLAPSTLHALAYLAEREHTTPAEMARGMIGALVSAQLDKRGWREDWSDTYRAWLAEQGAIEGRAESPSQDDYDRLAQGLDVQDTRAVSPAEWRRFIAATTGEAAPTAVRASRRAGRIGGV